MAPLISQHHFGWTAGTLIRRIPCLFARASQLGGVPSRFLFFACSRDMIIADALNLLFFFHASPALEYLFVSCSYPVNIARLIMLMGTCVLTVTSRFNQSLHYLYKFRLNRVHPCVERYSPFDHHDAQHTLNVNFAMSTC